MTPRELQSEEGDEERLVAEPNEETSLLVTDSRNDRLQKRDTWTSQVQQEIMEQSKTFVPALQSLVLSKIPWFITLRILGEMDSGAAFGGVAESDHSQGVELAAAALATTLCNVTGMSLCVGFSFALMTLAAQAKGEMVSRAANTKGSSRELSDLTSSGEDSESTPNTTVVFLLRGLLIQLVLVLPVGIWWLFGIEDFLIRLGQSPDLATHSATYLKILAPSLWVYSIQWTTTAWTLSIGMADVPAKAALLGLALHIPFNILFCYVLGMGYLGCAYATIMFQAVQGTYIICYLFVYPWGRQRVLESTGGSAVGRTTLTLIEELKIAGGSIRSFCSYLSLALPGIIIISEWWASETAIFLSGRLSPNPQTTLAAMTIYQAINAFAFMVPAAVSSAGTARVGNLLGAGNPSGASMAGTVSVGLCAVCSGAIGITLYTLPHEFIPSLFLSTSENRAVVDQVAATLPLLAFYVFADGVQNGFNGIIKGCGRQGIAVPIVVAAYWIVGVPLAYYLGLYRSGGDDTLCAHIASDGSYDPSAEGMIFCGDVGLVAGMTVGTWCHMLLLAFVVIGTTNWKNEAYKAKQRVMADQVQQKRQKRRSLRKQDTEREHRTSSRKKDVREIRSDGDL
jgi:MATE family multidrug resistance protein